jgi:hypothetical protein
MADERDDAQRLSVPLGSAELFSALTGKCLPVPNSRTTFRSNGCRPRAIGTRSPTAGWAGLFY